MISFCPRRDRRSFSPRCACAFPFWCLVCQRDMRSAGWEGDCARHVANTGNKKHSQKKLTKLVEWRKGWPAVGELSLVARRLLTPILSQSAEEGTVAFHVFGMRNVLSRTFVFIVECCRFAWDILPADIYKFCYENALPTGTDVMPSIGRHSTCSLMKSSVRSRSALVYPAHEQLPPCLAITRFTVDVLARRSSRRAGSSSLALTSTERGKHLFLVRRE